MSSRYFSLNFVAMGCVSALLALGCDSSNVMPLEISAPTEDTGGSVSGTFTGTGGMTSGTGGQNNLDVAGTQNSDTSMTGGMTDTMMDAAMGGDTSTTTVDAGTTDPVDAMMNMEPEPPKPPCLKDGSQVVLLGDSYINWVSHTFPADLNALAGETYRMYAVGGYSMGSGGLGFIPPEFDQAMSEDPDITTIVMTGGGNDILVPDTAQFPQGGDCKMSDTSPTIPDCQKIVAKALDAAGTMLDNVAAQLPNQTTHVVYFFYPNVPEGTVVGGTHPNAILEYSAPMVKDFCDSTEDRSGGTVVCHFVDLRPVFAGHTEYFAPTDIHPNATGSAAMAKAVWETMVDNCLAQPESSGCCEP